MLYTPSKVPKKETIVNTLTIAAKQQKPLSKNQLQFNKLTKQIESLEKSIEIENAKCEILFQSFNKDILPVEMKVANARMELAMVFDSTIYKYKFSKNQQQNIADTILDMCDKAFKYIEPNPEQEEMYNRWSESTYKEEIENQENELKDEFLDMMKFMFGVDIDPELINGSIEDNPDKLEEIINQLKENQEPKSKKKTAKQIKREEQEKAEEIIKNKSIRSIYIALAKILHPDTETDPILKIEKEELMKQVTVAFDKKDMTTLLKLEMEWVHKQSEHLENLTEEKLKIYVSALKQQVLELEQKRESIYYNPRYSVIKNLIEMPENNAKSQIKRIAKEVKKTYESLSLCNRELKRPNQKKEIVGFVDGYCELIEDEKMFSLSDFLF